MRAREGLPPFLILISVFMKLKKCYGIFVKKIATLTQIFLGLLVKLCETVNRYMTFDCNV